jgi:hypothetical protein
MARIIWDKPDNPPKYVSDRLGIRRWQLGDAIHEQQMTLALRSVLSYMMTVRSRMSRAMPSGTSTTKSDNAIRAAGQFASLLN